MGKDDRRRATLACGFAVVGFVALGEVREVRADDVRDQARELVAAGLVAQERGELAVAIEKYQQAYELIPHPELLFNLGQAYRLKGEAATAASFYRRYLAVAPRGRAAKEAAKWAAQLEVQAVNEGTKQLQAPKAASGGEAVVVRVADSRREPAKPGAPVPAPGTLAGPGGRSASPALSAPTASAIGVPRIERSSGEGRGRRWTGITLASAGIVGLGAGAALYWRAHTLSDELSQKGAAYNPGKIEDGESASRWSRIAFIAGGALIVGGTSLYLWGRSAASEGHDDRERLAWSPAITPDSAALTVSGVFQ